MDKNGVELEGGAARRTTLFVGSVAKALRVLASFSAERHTMGLQEIAAAAGLDRSGAQRFAHTLHELGYLRKDPATRRYALAPKVLEIGFAYLQSDPLVARAQPYLEEAHRQCDETVNLTELDGTEIVYLARLPSRHAVSVHLLLGARLPAWCSAPGRAMLAFAPERDWLALLERSEVRRHTPYTVTAPSELAQRLAEVRRLGYATNCREYFENEISVAAPVFDYAERPVAAVNIAVTVDSWSEQSVRAQLGPVATACAGALSRDLGGRRPPPGG